MRSQSFEQKSPIAELYRVTSFKKLLISAQGFSTKELAGLIREAEMMEEPYSTQSQIPTALSTGQGGQTRMRIRPYSLNVELMADRWETIIPRPTDNLPAHIKGAAEWVDYNEPNRSCYVV